MGPETYDHCTHSIDNSPTKVGSMLLILDYLMEVSKLKLEKTVKDEIKGLKTGFTQVM